MIDLCNECNKVNCICSNLKVQYDEIVDSYINALSDSSPNSKKTCDILNPPNIIDKLTYVDSIHAYLNTPGFHIGFLNICHLLPKLDEVKGLLSEHKSLDVFGFCETFLTDDTTDSSIQINNFSCVRRDRKYKRGGGIAVYISDNVPFHRRSDLENSDIESVWIEIKFDKRKPFLLNFVYRPPDSQQVWIDNYKLQLAEADMTSLDYYVLGDFNINYFPDDIKCNYSNSRWNDIVFEYGLTQLIENPTRVMKSSSTIIDHIYVNNVNNINKVSVPNISMSDHYPVCITLSTKNYMYEGHKKQHKHITYRSFKNFNESLFRSDLNDSNLKLVETFTDPNVALNMFYDTLKTVLDKHAPLKEKRIKREYQPKWITDEIKILMRKRDECHKHGQIDQFKILRNKITSLIRKSKRDYFNKAVQDNKTPGVLWRNLKSISNKQQHGKMRIPNEIITNDGRSVEGSTNIVDEMNKHFVNISSTINSSQFNEDNFKHVENI